MKFTLAINKVWCTFGQTDSVIIRKVMFDVNYAATVAVVSYKKQWQMELCITSTAPQGCLFCNMCFWLRFVIVRNCSSLNTHQLKNVWTS